jgi:hypothetical protein
MCLLYTGPMPPPRLTKVKASSSILDWLFPYGNDRRTLSSFCEARLLDENPKLHSRWCAGRSAPVTLRLELSEGARKIGFCPETDPGEVSLVLVDEDTGQRTGYIGPWRDSVWIEMEAPNPASKRLRVEFVTSPSFIALRALRFSA